MSEKNSTKKAVKAKDKRHPKKTLGVVPTDNQEKISALVLYLRSDGTVGFKSTNRPPVGKSISWSLSKIRHQSFKITMRPLQFILRRNGGRILQKDVKRNRAKRNGKVGTRPPKNRKSL